MNIQKIKSPDGGEMVVLPRAEFDAIMAALEDRNDAETASAILARIKAGTEQTFPAEVASAILDGENPIKVFRAFRHMTQRELAERAGTSSVYLSQIERGERAAGKSILAALAKALNVPADLIRDS